MSKVQRVPLGTVKSKSCNARTNRAELRDEPPFGKSSPLKISIFEAKGGVPCAFV